MKKLLIVLILSVAMVSCYEDYIKDYDFNSVSFPYQTDVRTFVVGEGMKIEVGVALGGVRENTKDRIVSFTIDNSLVTPSILTLMKGGAAYIKDAVAPVTTLTPIPTNYYTLSDNSKMVIKAGQHMGSVVLKVDSAAFLADSKTLFANYAIPFYITEADADSILPDKRSAVIGLKYENMLFGNYWHGGAALLNRPGKPDTTIIYRTSIPTSENKIWKLATKGPAVLAANGYLDQTTAKDEMILTLDGTKISISTATGSTFTVLQDGECTFNRAKLLQNRKIFLKYKYVNSVNGYTYHATDTLTFRNRLRDGVNEWQDENPNNYK